MLKRDPLAYFLLVASSALFATGYIVARAIDPAGGMGMFVTQTMLASAVSLSLLGGRRKRSAAWSGHLPAIALNGAGTPAIVFLVLSGSKTITPSLASIIVISNVLLIALFAWALGRKRFNVREAAALAAGFGGVVWISLERGAIGGEWGGVVMLAASSLLIAVLTVAIERPIVEIGGVVVTRWIFWAAFAASFSATALTGGLRFYSMEQTGLAVFLGVFGMGASVLMFNIGMGRIGSADAAAFKLMIPFFALVYGFLILGEAPSPGSFAAGLVVVGSVWLYQRSGSGGSGLNPAVRRDG